MSFGTTAGARADFELLLQDGLVWLPLSLAPARDDSGRQIEGAAKSIETVLAPAESQQSPISKRLSTVIQDDWSRGLGLDYDAAYGVYTRTPGYALPAGKATPVTVTASGNSATPIVAIEEYNSDLFFAQRGGGNANEARVMISDGGTGTGGGALANSLQLGANEYMRDLIVFSDGSNNIRLYASSSDVNGLNGKLHQFDGATWTSTPGGRFGTNGRNRMRKVFWRTADNIGAWRLVTISGRNTISYTLPSADPMQAASWVEGVEIETGYTLLELAGARRHVYVTAKDGVFDLDELGDSPNLVPYWEQMVQPFNGEAAIYHDGYLYAGFGRGLDRVRVEQGSVIQESPGQCAPGWGTRAENEVRGYVTSQTTDQGYLVTAVYNPTVGKAFICWGKDRAIIGVETPNPLVWWGPEIHSATNYYVNRMRTSALAGDLRLWLCGQSGTGLANPILEWVSLPIAGSPLQDLVSGGLHRFAGDGASSNFQTFSRLHGLADDGGDEAALKIVHETVYSTRGISVADGAYLQTYDRADAAPGTWHTGWGLSADVDASPVDTIQPVSGVYGRRLEQRIDWISTNGGATPPKVAVLDAVRRTYWKAVPSFSVRQLEVEYGDTGVVVGGQAQVMGADWITDQLLDLTASGLTTLRDTADKRWTVKVEQVFGARETLHEGGPNGKTVRASLEITIVSGPQVGV